MRKYGWITLKIFFGFKKRNKLTSINWGFDFGPEKAYVPSKYVSLSTQS